MFLKSISRFLCVSLALASVSVFAEDVFRVDILHVVKGVEKPMSLYVNEGQPGSISLKSTEESSSFDATVEIVAQEKEGVFSVHTTINTTDSAGLPKHTELHGNALIGETPVVVGGSEGRDEQVTITVARVDASSIPSQKPSN